MTEELSKLDTARQLAAQCWCDDRTSHITMVPELAHVFADMIIDIQSQNNESTKEDREGYTSFGNAIYMLKCGFKVARKGWANKDMFIQIVAPDENSILTKSHIYSNTTGPQGGDPGILKKSPYYWTATQGDILTDDWVVVE